MLGHKLNVTTFLLLLIMSTSTQGWGEAADNHDKAGQQRGSATELKLPETYEKLKASLEKIQVRINLTAVGADSTSDKPVEKEFALNREAELKEWVEITNVIGKYSNKLKKCGEDRDKSAEQIGALIDWYMSYLQKTVGEDANKAGKLDEKKINTFTLQIQKILKVKAEKFKSTKDQFEKSDKELVEKLDRLAGVLWGVKVGGTPRKNKFDEAAAKKDNATTKIVDDADAAIKSLESRLTSDGVGDRNSCKLDEVPASAGTTNTPGTTNSSGTTNAVGGTQASTATTAPPIDPSAGTSNVPGTTNFPGTTNNFGTANQFGTANAIGTTNIGGGALFDPSGVGSLQSNQLQDFATQLRQQQELLRIQEEANRRNLELQLQASRDQQAANDANNGQLQRIAEQGIRGAGSRSATRGDQVGETFNPNISPQVGITRNPPPPPYPPQGYPQLPPPIPFNPMAALAGMASPAAPIMPYQPSKFRDEDYRPRPLPPMQDPLTQVLMETLKQQQAMWQNMMMGKFPWMNSMGGANQQMMGGGGFMQNVNSATVGSMLQGFGQGIGGAFGRATSYAGRVMSNQSGPRVNSLRMNGSATSGGPAQLSGNISARTQLPARLK